MQWWCLLDGGALRKGAYTRLGWAPLKGLIHMVKCHISAIKLKTRKRGVSKCIPRGKVKKHERKQFRMIGICSFQVPGSNKEPGWFVNVVPGSRETGTDCCSVALHSQARQTGHNKEQSRCYCFPRVGSRLCPRNYAAAGALRGRVPGAPRGGPGTTTLAASTDGAERGTLAP